MFSRENPFAVAGSYFASVRACGASASTCLDTYPAIA